MLKNDDISFTALFRAHPIPMWVYDLATLKFLAVNAAAVEHYGYTEAEFLGMTIEEIRPSVDIPKLLQNLKYTQSIGIEKSGIWTHQKKDGTSIDVEITSHPLSFNGRPCKFVLANDVTERQRAQSRIARLSRISSVLSGINSAIVRIRDRDALFREACRLATTEGAFAAASIGLVDPYTLNIKTVASSGFELDSFHYAALSMRSDTPAREGPARRAVREARPVICNDINTESALGPLRAHFAERGHLALAAFPLLVEQRADAVLVLVAAAADYFDDEELDLLTELAGDISFALEYLEREEQRKRGVLKLRESEAGLRRAQIMNKTGHVITGPTGAFESWSETLPELIGCGNAGVPPDTRKWLDIVHPNDRMRFRDCCIEAAVRGTRMDVEYRVVRTDGAVVHFRQVLEPLEGDISADGKRRWFNTIQDISEQKEQQQRLDRLSRTGAVLSGINSAIVRVHTRDALFQEACRIAVNQGAFSMAWIGMIDPNSQDGAIVAWSGDDRSLLEEIIKFTPRSDTQDPAQTAWVAVREMRPVACNDIARDASSILAGELVKRGHRSAIAYPLIVDDRVIAVIALYSTEEGFFEDKDELKLLDELAGDLSFALQFIDKEEQLSYLAYYDVLTGLANSRLYHDRTTQFLAAHRQDQSIVAVIVINLDRFAQLNDTLGRHAGDALLVQFAKRLGDSLVEPYSLARIGGDSFAIAFTDLQQGEETAILEQQVFSTLDHVFMLDHQEIRITAHAGLALYPADGTDSETLLKHAEVALNKAKSSGERYLYYAPQMNTALVARLALEHELRHALEARQFVMYYQPRVDLSSGSIISAEALIRWQHPERGIVGPVEFISLAEETGLIVPIGAWVIDAVCAQQATWLQQHIDIVPVAVNLSAIQFKHGQVLQTINDAVTRHQLEQKYIEFELTESIVMDDPDEATRNLNAMKKLGMKLSLDDFGTGYSSLAYLKRFPFDFVKIDRTFISDVTNNPGDAAIATAVVAMAHSLKLRVVAEGVETEGQLQFLRKLHCDEMQGYYFSPPVPAEAFLQMLQEDKRLPSMHQPSETGNTLLVVDDEPNIRSALQRLLRRDGYRVLSANSGQEGLDLLAVNQVHVIITDQRMPGMSGSEFLAIVKDLYPDTIRIILSGYTDLASVTEGVNQGAVFKFLTKPWDDELLREHVRDAFHRYRPLAGRANNKKDDDGTECR